MAEKGVVVRAHLRMPDLERAVRFYTETLGLTEQSQETGVSRLSTPTQRDDQCPLTLRTGQRGLDRVVLGESEAAVHGIESRLTERGTAFERRDERVGQTIAVTLPSGLPMQFHSRKSDQDETQTRSSRAPRGIDHITVASPDVRADAEFLRDELGFRLFDVAMAGPGIWGRAFARRGDGTHDVALLQEPLASSTRLHHVAWRARSVNHVTGLAERVRTAGFEVDIDMQRTVDGTHAAVYARDPAGHRLELATEPTGRTPAAPISLAAADHDDIDVL